MTTSDGIQILVGLVVGGDLLATLVTNTKLNALNSKVDSMQAEFRLAMTQMAEHATSIARLEARYEALKDRYDDLAGFLQSLGFKKRDGPPPP